jgi:cobalt-zinc-cadmium efflux system membrane fusion protein
MLPNSGRLFFSQPPWSTGKKLLLVSLAISTILAAFALTRAQGPAVSPKVPEPATSQWAGVDTPPDTPSGQAPERSAAVQPRAPQPIATGQRIALPQNSPLRNELMIMAATATQIERTLDLPGVVEPDPARTIQILPPAIGRIVDVKVRIGDRVAQDQELAVIYLDDSLRAEKGDIPAPSPADAQIGFERIDDGGARAIRPSEPEIKQVAKLRALGTPVEGMKQTRLLSLKAPVAGSVIDLPIAVGTVLNESSAPMTTITNLDTILVAINVPIRELATIATRQPVQVRISAYPREHFKSEALLIGAPLDHNAPSAKVRIVLRNPDARLKPNLYAYATFTRWKEAAIVVPISALIPTYSMDLVLVEVAQGLFEARAVRVGQLEGGQVVVESGLDVGERIVVKGSGMVLAARSH